MPTLKGIAANELDGWAALRVQWAHVEFGHWLWDSPQQSFGAPCSFHLYKQIPIATEIFAAIQHPSFDGWWLVGGNEPDLEKLPAADGVTLLKAQIDAVKATHPTAKFCATLGSQIHAPTKPSAWFPPVWNALPAPYKASIGAFHTHFYAGVLANPANLSSPAQIKTFLQTVRNWMNNSGSAARELWLTEIGLGHNTVTDTDPRTILYPQVVAQACSGLVTRWAWYIYEARGDGYFGLRDNHVPNCIGKVFAAM